MTLFYQMTAGDEIVMYADELTKWDAPHDNSPLTDEEISQVQDNISEDLLRHKIPVIWD